MGDIRTKQESQDAIGRAVAYPTRKQQPIDLDPRSVCVRLGWGKGNFGRPKPREGQTWMLALHDTFILDGRNGYQSLSNYH